MSLYALKPRFQAFLRPLVAWLAAKRITANAVTVMATAGSVAIAGIVIWKADERLVFLLMPLWLFVRMALNAIDGMLAREFGQKSSARRLSERNRRRRVGCGALCAVRARRAIRSDRRRGVIVCLSILAEFAGVLGPPVGASRRYDGPMGKSDRALVFGALACWIGLAESCRLARFWQMPRLAASLLVTTCQPRSRRASPKACTAV